MPRKMQGGIISIHAPAKGATAYSIAASSQMRISIHAPAKGATPLRYAEIYDLNISIHAPAKGATMQAELQRTGYGAFQSTLPRRERQRCPVPRTRDTYFNPRSREGSDLAVDKDAVIKGISIHAPAKGATKPHGVFVCARRISIHAPAKGATGGRRSDNQLR